MIRLIFSLAALALSVVAALFFVDHPGSVTLVWQGWRIDSSVSVLLAILVMLFVALWVVLATLMRFVRAPTHFFRRRRESQHLQAYRVLTDGLVAIAAGDSRGAERLQRQALLLFGKTKQPTPPLVRLLSAQTALLRDDSPAADAEFTAMLDHPETEFLGLRGLIVQAMKRGDIDTALSLTERARRLRPEAGWVIQNQLTLETRKGDWAGARTTLKLAVKHKAVTETVARRHRVALLLAASRAADRDGRARDALKAAAQAHALDESFAPASVEYARLLGAAKRSRKGLRILETAWQRSPHPAIAAAYTFLLGTEAPLSRLKRFEHLVDLRPSDPDSHLAAAGVALSNQLWGEARRHLDAAGAGGPGPWSRLLCRHSAELERHQHGDEAAARLWLERGAAAPADPGWICAECGSESADWDVLCPVCEGFDTLNWQRADQQTSRIVDAARGPAVAASPMLDFDPIPSRGQGNPGAARQSRLSGGAEAETTTRGQGA